MLALRVGGVKVAGNPLQQGMAPSLAWALTLCHETHACMYACTPWPLCLLPADALVVGLANRHMHYYAINPPPEQRVQPGDELIMLRPER